MSESEKAKRAEFQKKRKKVIYILLAVALVLSMITAVFSVIFVEKNKDVYVYYSEDGSALYHAYLNDNEYYEEDRLNGNHAYVSSLIHHMDASFKYRLQMNADDVTYKYQYRVDAQLVITDKSSGAAIYNPVETILGPTSDTYAGKTFFINPTVEIDYVHYNDKAKAFIEQYKLVNVSAHLDVTMYVDVVGMSEAFAEDGGGQYTVQVRIPLNQATLKPQVTSTIPAGQQKVLANPIGNFVVFKILAIVFGILDGGVLVALAIYVIKTRDAHIDYTRKVQKIVNSYKSFIQKINNEFNTEGYQVLSVDTFSGMLEIRDTLGLPILMHENEDKTRTVFIIPANASLLYMFEIKVENYDYLYANDGEEATPCVDEDVAEEPCVEAEESTVNE